jgi:hypothetical protein
MSTDQIAVSVEATQYTVSVLPTDNVNYRRYAIKLEARPGARWVVATGHGDYINDAGEWTFGLDFSDEWRAAHWHTFDRAVELATAAALDVEVNGRSARDVLAAIEGKRLPQTARHEEDGRHESDGQGHPAGELPELRR